MGTVENLEERAKEIRGAFLPESVTNEFVGNLFLDIIRFIVINSGSGEGGKPDNRYWNKEELTVLDQYLYVLGEKIKAMYADEAGKAADSELWGGRDFNDWFDQQLHTFDAVKFKSVIADLFQTSTFAEGINGLKVDEFGNILARSLKLFDFLEVPELRYNKITVVGEEQWWTTGGVIEDILDDGNAGDNKYRIKLKLKDGDVNGFCEGDVCKGVFKMLTGFQSVYFIIVSSMDEPNFPAGIMDVVLTGNLVPPRKFMTIARIGNVLYDVVDGKTVARYPERQRSARVSVPKGNLQFFKNVDSWQLTSSNIAIHIGECKNAGLPGTPVDLQGNIIWADQIYTLLGVHSFDAEGNEIPEVTPVVEWEEGKSYTKNNQVSYLGCVYLCVAKSTTTKPRYDNPDWFMIQGNPGWVMKIISTEGERFVGLKNVKTTLVASVFKYNQDITGDIPAAQWTWTRESEYMESDLIWNSKNIGVGNTINITRSDFPGDKIQKCKFRCTAYIDSVNSVSDVTEYKLP